jgi:hypothetical protein
VGFLIAVTMTRPSMGRAGELLAARVAAGPVGA